MNTKSKHNSNRRGSITVEFTVALAIMVLIFSLVIASLEQVGKVNRGQWARQQCLAAAQAQLDSLSAVGRAIPESDWQRLWPRIDCTIEQTDGEGDWQGLALTQVTARTRLEGREIEVTSRRYIAPAKEAD